MTSARPCARLNVDGAPCGHTTTDPAGDCGRHPTVAAAAAGGFCPTGPPADPLSYSVDADDPAWEEAGFDEYDAEEWAREGFDPDTAREWSDAGFDGEPSSAAYWAQEEFDPGAAREWEAMSCNPNEAREWKEAGVSPDTASSWVDSGWDSTEAAAWIEYGFNDPTDARQWADADESFKDPGTARDWHDAGFEHEPEVAAEWKWAGFDDHDRDWFRLTGIPVAGDPADYHGPGYLDAAQVGELRDAGLDETDAALLLRGPYHASPAEHTTWNERFTTHTSYEVRVLAARNPAAPIDSLVLLADDDDEDVRAAAAANPTLPGHQAALLADDQWPKVRRAVAGRPDTPPDVLAVLALDSSEPVRAAAAANPNTPAPARSAAGLLTDP